jgi:hypothetical protein
MKAHAILSTLFFAGSAVAANLSPLAEVPYPMDSSNQAAWWSPIVEYNGSTYMAYNAPGSASNKHRVNVAKRTGITWTSACIKTSSGSCAEYDDDIGHNQPSISIDGDGFIHVFASMHHVDWRYFRSTNAESVVNVVNRSSDMPDAGGQYTYPVLASTGGDVYLIIRAQSGSGRAGRLYRWSNPGKYWQRLANFAYEAGKAVYPDDIKPDTNGDLHITWEWLGLNNGGPIRHMGSHIRYRPSTNQFFNAAGTALAVPVSTATSSVVFQPLTANESFATDCNSGCESNPGYQAGKLAIDPTNNRPQVLYRHRSTQGGNWVIKRARWTGSSWALEDIYAGSYDTIAALSLTHDGTTVRAYYVKKPASGTNYAHVAERIGRSNWVETALNAGTPIERISVIRRSTGADVLYLSSPSTGKLYLQTNDR